MLTRRVLGVVSGALVTTGFAPAASAAINESPLFSVQDKLAHVLSIHRYSPETVSEIPQIIYRITVERYEDGDPVKSVIAAEDRLFAGARDMHLDEIAGMLSSDYIWTETDQRRRLADLLAKRRNPDQLVFNIVRASNRIGKISRRGFGNHVLMHPSMFVKLLRSQPVSAYPALIQRSAFTMIGRWTEVAKMHHIRILLSEDALPPNDIVVFYRNVSQGLKENSPGVVDGPAAVIRDGANLALIDGPKYIDKIFRFTIPV